MKVTMLISNEEKVSMNKELLATDIVIHTDRSILEDIMNINSDVLVISKGFVDNIGYYSIVTFLNLIIKFTNIKPIYFVKDKESVDDVVQFFLKQGNLNIHKVNLATLDVESYMNAIKQDIREEPSEIKTDSTTSKYIKMIRDEISQLKSDETEAYIKRNKQKLLDIFDEYMSKIKETEVLKSTIKSYKDMHQVLMNVNDRLLLDLQTEKDKRDIIEKDLSSLRISIISQMDKIDNYNNKILNNGVVDEPRIVIDKDIIFLYFKEVEDIGFLEFYNSLIYTLSDIRGYYCKSVILEKNGRTYFDPYTKNGYTVVNRNTSVKTIIDNDKLVQYGNPTNLINFIARPEIRVQIVAILDRTGTEDIFVDSETCISFYIGSSRENITTLDIPDKIWISPIEGEWQNIKPLLGRKLTNENERLAYYANSANFPLTKTILAILRTTFEEEMLY